jgi:hypothetical protein
MPVKVAMSNSVPLSVPIQYLCPYSTSMSMSWELFVETSVANSYMNMDVDKEMDMDVGLDMGINTDMAIDTDMFHA